MAKILFAVRYNCFTCQQFAHGVSFWRHKKLHFYPTVFSPCVSFAVLGRCLNLRQSVDEILHLNMRCG